MPMTIPGPNAPIIARKPRWPWILMLLLLAALIAGWFYARQSTAPETEGGGPPGTARQAVLRAVQAPLGGVVSAPSRASARRWQASPTCR
jgi:hypothetical protein